MRRQILIVAAFLGILIPFRSLNGQTADSQPVVIASKPFAESYLLAEMFTQVLEAQGIPIQGVGRQAYRS